MRTTPAALAVLALAGALAACGHARPAGTAGTAYVAEANAGPSIVAAARSLGGRCVSGLTDARISRSRNLLLPDRIPGANGQDLLSVITRHRSLWLVSRGVAGVGATAAVVYVDDVRYGGVEALRSVTASSIRLARYLTGPQAHLKYGMNHSEGAIELYTSCGKA